MSAAQKAALRYFAALAKGSPEEFADATHAWISEDPEGAGDLRVILRAMASVLTEEQAHQVVACLAANVPSLILEACDGLI